MARKTIQFAVDEEQKKDIEHYAKVNGFDKSGNLARKALFTYMSRLPLKKSQMRQCGSAVKSESANSDDLGGESGEQD